MNHSEINLLRNHNAGVPPERPGRYHSLTRQSEEQDSSSESWEGLKRACHTQWECSLLCSSGTTFWAPTVLHPHADPRFSPPQSSPFQRECSLCSSSTTLLMSCNHMQPPAQSSRCSSARRECSLLCSSTTTFWAPTVLNPYAGLRFSAHNFRKCSLQCLRGSPL